MFLSSSCKSSPIRSFCDINRAMASLSFTCSFCIIRTIPLIATSLTLNCSDASSASLLTRLALHCLKMTVGTWPLVPFQTLLAWPIATGSVPRSHDLGRKHSPTFSIRCHPVAPPPWTAPCFSPSLCSAAPKRQPHYVIQIHSEVHSAMRLGAVGSFGDHLVPPWVRGHRQTP